ncbi:MAG TPA: glycosyltransferase family A protein [Thermoleophilaceae bacterium]|nr:glycosyltransferase family A protein [Thermoleophilaceae bacterium]
MRLRIVNSTDDRAAELLSAVADEAAAAGADVVTDPSPPPGSAEDVCLFVPLAGAPDPANCPAAPMRSIALCTAHPGSPTFDISTQLASRADRAFDLTTAGTLEQRRRGVRAERFRLGLGERWHIPKVEAAGERPCEILFLGPHNSRRERMLAANASALAASRSAIHLGSPNSESSALPAGADRAILFTRASLVLDVHPFRPHGIDWTLALQAIGAGALPVFEHVLDPYPLVPRQHMMVANGDQLATVARGLLDDPERLREMAGDARRLACQQLPMRPSVERLLAIAESITHRPRLRQRRARSRSRSDATAVTKEPEQPPALDVRSRARKLAALDVIANRRLAKQRELEAQDVPLAARRIHETPAWASARPSVAMCVPVHNDGETAVLALESATGCDGVEIELLVFDDGSTDDSLDRVITWMERRPHVAGSLTSSPVNRGLGAARNVMLTDARAPYAFMLDADNLVYPRALAALVDALEKDPDAVFAYGLLERRRGTRSVGLLSAGPWEPARLRSGNYIDAMALLRREAVLEIGGFGESLSLYGWEDFDLWCRVAEHDLHAQHVPTFIGRYHERPESMLSVASIDASDAVRELRGRYPRLAPDIPRPEAPA